MAKTTKAKRLHLHSKTGPLTPEEQLKADRDSWRADVYQHFHPDFGEVTEIRDKVQVTRR